LLAIYAKEEINQDSFLSPKTAYKDPSTLIKRYPLYIKKLKATGISELNQYLGDETVDHDIEDAHFDLLGWWKENGSRYPVLSRMARDVLAIPVCIYSVEEDLKLDLSVLQGASPELVEAVICSKDWILSDVQR
jgi:hAT family C-terminal dimerisation region